jgi:hypothetical protein
MWFLGIRRFKYHSSKFFYLSKSSLLKKLAVLTFFEDLIVELIQDKKSEQFAHIERPVEEEASEVLRGCQEARGY